MHKSITYDFVWVQLTYCILFKPMIQILQNPTIGSPKKVKIKSVILAHKIGILQGMMLKISL